MKDSQIKALTNLSGGVNSPCIHYETEEFKEEYTLSMRRRIV